MPNVTMETFAVTQSDVYCNLLPHKSIVCSTWLIYDPDLDLKGGGVRRGPGRPLEATARPPPYLQPSTVPQCLPGGFLGNLLREGAVRALDVLGAWWGS